MIGTNVPIMTSETTLKDWPHVCINRIDQVINATVFQQLTFELLSHVLTNVVVRSVVTAIDY